MSDRNIKFVVIYLVFNLLHLVMLLMALKKWSVMGVADLVNDSFRTTESQYHVMSASIWLT